MSFGHEKIRTTKAAEYSFMRNGDLVLRRGRSAESFAVLMLDKNRTYSHIGIVYIRNGIPYIIHVVPDRPGLVRSDPPEEFLSEKNASHYTIVRSDFEPVKLNAVAAQAWSFYSRKLAFDEQYDLASDNKLYCTELVIKAFNNSGIFFPDMVPQKLKLLVGSYAVIMPESFLANSHFTGIEAR